MAAGLTDYLKRRRTSSQLSALFSDAAVAEFTLLTATGEVLGLRSTYIVQLFVIFPALSLILVKYLSPHWQRWADIGEDL